MWPPVWPLSPSSRRGLLAHRHRCPRVQMQAVNITVACLPRVSHTLLVAPGKLREACKTENVKPPEVDQTSGHAASPHLWGLSLRLSEEMFLAVTCQRVPRTRDTAVSAAGHPCPGGLSTALVSVPWGRLSRAGRWL